MLITLSIFVEPEQLKLSVLIRSNQSNY